MYPPYEVDFSLGEASFSLFAYKENFELFSCFHSKYWSQEFSFFINIVHDGKKNFLIQPKENKETTKMRQKWRP